MFYVDKYVVCYIGIERFFWEIIIGKNFYLLKVIMEVGMVFSLVGLSVLDCNLCFIF